MASKIKKFFLEVLASLGMLTLWIFCVFIIFYTLPYLFEKHFEKDLDDVPPIFQVAITEKEQPQLINWKLYTKNPNQYLLMESNFKNNTDKDSLKSLTKKEDGSYETDASFSLLRNWSRYKIENNQVIPISYLERGGMSLFYAFIGGFLLVGLIKRLIARFFSKPILI